MAAAGRWPGTLVCPACLLDAAAAALRGATTGQLLAGAPAGHARILPALLAASSSALASPNKLGRRVEMYASRDGGAASAGSPRHAAGRVAGGRWAERSSSSLHGRPPTCLPRPVQSSWWVAAAIYTDSRPAGTPQAATMQQQTCTRTVAAAAPVQARRASRQQQAARLAQPAAARQQQVGRWRWEPRLRGCARLGRPTHQRPRAV